MPRRLATAGKFLMVVSLCAALGLHWAALQSIAWAGMLIHYSRSGNVAEAILKTFDGRHPCPLCQAIAKSDKGGKKSDSNWAAGKMDMEYRPPVARFVPPGHDFRWFPGSQTALGFSPEPVVPPPRAA